MLSSLAPQGVRPAAASGARPAPVIARRPASVAGVPVPQGSPMMLAEVLCRQVRACRIPFGTAQRGPGPLAAVASPERVAQQPVSTTSRPLKVLIAGAGIGGLVLAVALLKKGIDVQIFERDMTAIRGEGKYRGPIQIQSNALAALEAIDEEVAEEVMASGCITGDRVNGLCDGVTGAWYVKFDTFHHAVDNGLPVTRVISRVTLQQILARAVERYAGPEAIQGNSHVMQYSESVSPETGLPVVSVTLEDGRVFSGDMLVGTDGIWSKTRKQMLGESAPNYSQYTCYTGISDFTPADIDVVGYRVFLGNRMYFVSSDVGGGKVQWYAFHKEPAGGTDPEGQRKRRLLELFGHWNDNVVDLIKATPEEDVLRRDIYDRPPIFKWSEGRVALLGDSAHAMQPNLGQGGCMAIEDAYRLADLLAGSSAQAAGDLRKIPVERLLKQYQNDRIMRVSTIHGMAGMAAFMASTYKAYLGEGFSQWLVNTFHILHPGRVAGQLVMNLTMPAVLGWVLGGNVGTIAGSRKATCRLEDHPKAFPERLFSTLMKDDEAIIRNCHADWLLAAERVTCYDTATTSSLLKGIYIDETPAVLGSTQASCSLLVEGPDVAERHAKVWKQRDGKHFLQDLKSGKGTWVNGVQLAPGATVELKFQDVVELGQHPAPEPFRVKMQHVSLRTDELNGHQYSTLLVGRKQDAVNAQAAEEAAAAVASDAAKLAVA